MTQELADIIDSSAELLAILNENRDCDRCGFTYQERTNIGHWKCKRYHPFFQLTSPTDRTYKCCGRTVGSDGCVEADHIDGGAMERVEPTKVAPHTAALFDECKVKPQNIHIDSATGVMLIDRFDYDAYERVTNPTLVVSDETLAKLERKLAMRVK